MRGAQQRGARRDRRTACGQVGGLVVTLMSSTLCGRLGGDHGPAASILRFLAASEWPSSCVLKYFAMTGCTDASRPTVLLRHFVGQHKAHTTALVLLAAMMAPLNPIVGCYVVNTLCSRHLRGDRDVMHCGGILHTGRESSSTGQHGHMWSANMKAIYI